MMEIVVWQKIKEAVESLGGRASHGQVREFILARWPETNVLTINTTLTAHTVNLPARVNYPKNKKPRIANSNFDFLFSIGPGQIVLFDPLIHGSWEIYINELGKATVRQINSEQVNDTGYSDDEVASHLFALEAHLRDFLIDNLQTFKPLKVNLYIDESGRNGKEYPTDVGPIDLLLIDNDNNFVVVETKLSRGADKAVGQLLRYMGWIKNHISKNQTVKGIVVANKMDDKIKYAASVIPEIYLYEYEMTFKLSSSGL